jgi:hypothetical protein
LCSGVHVDSEVGRENGEQDEDRDQRGEADGLNLPPAASDILTATGR